MSRIRPPSVSGMFYPKDPKKLGAAVDLLLKYAPQTEFKGEIFGMIVPHAGYVYSGRTAAFAFNLLKNLNIKTVIILSPSHHEYFPGVSIYDGDSFQTPLGLVQIDNEMADNLISGSKEIMRATTGHFGEHAIEVEIPFLQKILKDFKIVPIVMGDQKPRYINELAMKIADVYEEGVLILASSDLSHYHSRSEAGQKDGIIEQRIKDFDFEKLLIDFEVKRCEACGGGPIIALMKAASIRKFNKSLILHRSDSGETSGNISEVVGYLSAVMYK